MNEGRCRLELDAIHQYILRMGALVEEAIHNADKALMTQDLALARKVVAGDDDIDQLEKVIEALCLELLALKRPLAGDLRAVTTALKVITDLERMGDHATNIAEVALKLGEAPLIKPLIDIPRLSSMALQMVHSSLDAFVRRDVELAEKVCRDDLPVDRLYFELYDVLLGFIMEGGDKIRAGQALSLLLVARFLERIADHATNIAERVGYLVYGDCNRVNQSGVKPTASAETK
ncbi:MAG TPA: phosphate signaling complex protein PhoU [Firmicutes bacterium]|nr:phosphate signaling complex protein PhoU [Bacillota bacterium]